ncbi:MAG: hypothetical protein FWH54_03715 [Methanobrevibacter sp.]|nr:hypothetical protein [Methanobrevibacter sp.]
MIYIFNEIIFKKRKLFIIFSIFLIAILSISTISFVSAANITISPTTSGGLLTAIDTAKNGDTIYLENGVYTGEDNIELRIDKNITLRGKGKNVVIDAQNKYTYFFQMIKKDSANKNIPVSVNLINLKIINFKGDVIDNCGNLKVNNCIFANNKIDGAIIANYKGSNSEIANSVFTKNTFNSVNDEGGVAIYNDNVANLSLIKSNFTNFKCTGDSFGVAIQSFGTSNILINKCNFKNTGKGTTISSWGKKANIQVKNSNFINDTVSINNIAGFFHISKSTFKKNKLVSIINYMKMKISGSTFSKCAGFDGILDNGGSLNISSSFFKNNKGTFDGAITNTGTMNIRSSKFSGNTATNCGGAITNMGTMSIKNSKFSGNSAKKYAGAICNGKVNNSGILKVINTKFTNNIVGKTYKSIYNDKESKITITKVKITPREGTKVKK